MMMILGSWNSFIYKWKRTKNASLLLLVLLAQNALGMQDNLGLGDVGVNQNDSTQARRSQSVGGVMKQRNQGISSQNFHSPNTGRLSQIPMGAESMIPSAAANGVQRSSTHAMARPANDVNMVVSMEQSKKNNSNNQENISTINWARRGKLRNERTERRQKWAEKRKQNVNKQKNKDMRRVEASTNAELKALDEEITKHTLVLDGMCGHIDEIPTENEKKEDCKKAFNGVVTDLKEKRDQKKQELTRKKDERARLWEGYVNEYNKETDENKKEFDEDEKIRATKFRNTATVFTILTGTAGIFSGLNWIGYMMNTDTTDVLSQDASGIIALSCLILFGAGLFMICKFNSRDGFGCSRATGATVTGSLLAAGTLGYGLFNVLAANVTEVQVAATEELTGHFPWLGFAFLLTGGLILFGFTVNCAKNLCCSKNNHMIPLPGGLQAQQ